MSWGWGIWITHPRASTRVMKSMMGGGRAHALPPRQCPKASARAREGGPGGGGV